MKKKYKAGQMVWLRNLTLIGDSIEEIGICTGTIIEDCESVDVRFGHGLNPDEYRVAVFDHTVGYESTWFCGLEPDGKTYIIRTEDPEAT